MVMGIILAGINIISIKAKKTSSNFKLQQKILFETAPIE